MRVVVTRIEWDGTMRRRLVDTAGRNDASQWEGLVARALAIRPLYRPVPERPLYHVQVNEWAVLVAEDDLSGPLSDLVTAVLAMGETRLWPVPERPSLARMAEKGQTRRMRLEVTRIAQDGDIRRRMLDTTGRVDAGRWENLVAQAPAAPPPYRAEPGATVYQISVGERTLMVTQAELTGGLRDLAMAVLAEGEEVLPAGCQRWSCSWCSSVSPLRKNFS